MHLSTFIRMKFLRSEWVLIPCVFLLALLLCAAIIPVRTSADYSTVVYAADSSMLHVFLNKEDKWRLQVKAGEVSLLLKKILLFKEDKYFRFHPGVNPLAVVRAAWNNFIKGRRTSGASTLTMQVVRLLYPAERTVTNKMLEMFRAFQLELRLSKDDILSLYLSLAPFGGNREGIQAASLMYFGKDVRHLSLSESVILAIIPNRPNSLSPFKNPQELVAVRNLWLKRLKEEKIITEDDFLNAVSEPLPLKKFFMPRQVPHLALRLKKQYPLSSRIYTYIEVPAQKKSEQLLSDYMKNLQSIHVYNAAVLIIDNRQHAVMAYCGSQDFYDGIHFGQVDGLRALRSPGSTLKPAVYALAMDQGLITPKTVITDVPVDYAGYAPSNYDNKYRGTVTAEQALIQSLNIPAVKLLDQTGLNNLLSMLGKAQFQSLKGKEHQLGLSLVLGGCSVSPEEMAGLFSAFRSGIFIKPSLIKSERHDSKLLISAPAAFMISEILMQTERPDFPENFQQAVNTPRIAWKTGTSYGRRDAWAIGYNDRYTIAVWIGNFSGEGAPELAGARVATPLLFRLFSAIDNKCLQPWLQPPSGLDYRMVCSISGMPANDFCEQRITDWFIPSVSPYLKCNHLVKVFLSHHEKFSYCMNCLPETGYKEKMFTQLSPELMAYYRNEKIPFNEIPPHNPSCSKIISGKSPVIIQPADGKEYLMEKDTRLKLQCLTDADVSEVYWYHNNRFLRKAAARDEVFINPIEGQNTISCTDDKGRSAHSEIKVVIY
jgi:penicillin-binding protein 1C